MMVVRNTDTYAYDSSFENKGLCYTACIYADNGRGMYATSNQNEIDWLQEAVERYDNVKSAAKKLEAEVTRLKKVNAKLRKQLSARKG